MPRQRDKLPRRNEKPLEYMLRLMNDPNVPDSRRDRMANMAAPYVHPRLIPTKASKKATQAQDALTAGRNTQWADDLETDKQAN